jgi:signal transduction histidine kinase
MRRLRLSNTDTRIFLLGTLFSLLSVTFVCGISYQWLKWQTRQHYFGLLANEAQLLTKESQYVADNTGLVSLINNYGYYAMIPLSFTIFDENIKVFCSTEGNQVVVPESFREAVLEQGFYEKVNPDEQIKGGTFNHDGKKWFWMISGNDESGKTYLQKALLVLLVLGMVFFLASSFTLLVILQKKSELSKKLNLTVIDFMRKNTGEEFPESYIESEQDVTGDLINALIKRVEIWQQSQRNFIHFASHELRTPIAILIAQTELAAQNPENRIEQQDFFKKQLQELGVLSGFIESILLLSNVEKADDPNRRYMPLRVDEILFKVVSFYQNLYPEKSIQVSFAMIPDHEEMLVVQGIESLLVTALSNLLSNAIQYSNNEPVEIKIYFANARVVLEFINDGTVIPESSRELLFTPFYRGTSSSGLGIGLSLTKKIIQLHKGTIYYHADIQQRNVFSVTLA